MAEKKKLSLICMSGDFDKAVAVFTLASGAAAVNYDVNVFFTFWGLNVIKKKPGRGFQGRGLLEKRAGRQPDHQPGRPVPESAWQASCLCRAACPCALKRRPGRRFLFQASRPVRAG